ncbi:ribonuclease R [Bdellovibrionota bacterium FG-2]
MKRQKKQEDRPANSGHFVDRSGRVHGKKGSVAPATPASSHNPAHKNAPKGTPSGARTARTARPNTHKIVLNRPEKQPPKEISAPRETRLRGTVEKNRKGFGFVIFEGQRREDAFVPPRDAAKLFQGDRVEVTLNQRGVVVDLKVLEHRFRELVGRYSPMPTQGKHPRGGFVVYERKRSREEVFVPEKSAVPKDGKAMIPGDWVRAKLYFHEKGPFPVTAEITQNYGSVLPASADIEMVAAEYNLTEEHTAAAVREAKEFKLDFQQVLASGREDLRKVPFITIDGETARDFDDAVFVERNKSGYRLWVAIADVSHYVRPGTALDKEALSRGTSVYFPERAFHMLPGALSENLCSLKPKEPRLAFVAKMEFDRNGVRENTQLIEAVIESHRRATYTEIQNEWQAQKRNASWEFVPHFELFRAIQKTRTARGSIDFDLPEAQVRVDDTGEPISITLAERFDSHRLIEEFMIAANEAVTEWMMQRKWPFIYRTHDEPAAEALLKFSKLAATAGVKFSLKGDNLNQALADLVRRLDKHPAQSLLNTALLRSLKRAIYSAIHGIHFGLASPGYTHFTSPIRRYPDLVVHRLLRHALQIEKRKLPSLKMNERDAMEKLLDETAEHCSYRERVATLADREATRLKQVRLMMHHLGEEFAGKIIGMAEIGMFVQIDAPYVEGLVTAESIGDDFYQFNEERMIFSGTRKKRTFRMGDPVRVRVTRADLDERKIDFQFIE